MKLCEYGCGQEAKYQFKNRKWCCSKSQNSCLSTRKKRSEIEKDVMNRFEVKEKRSKSMKEYWKRPGVRENHVEAQNRLEVKEKRSNSVKESWKRLEVRDNHIEALNRPEVKEEKRQRMLNGKSAYMNSCIKNPSDLELKLRNIVLELYSKAIPQYKVLENKNYTLDIALVDHNIAIEFDGWYHFNCQESIDYHNKRQEEIEKEGWKFIRYNIFQKFPTKQEIKIDIDKSINGGCLPCYF